MELVNTVTGKQIYKLLLSQRFLKRYAVWRTHLISHSGMLYIRFTALANEALEAFICDWSVHPLYLLLSKCTDGAVCWVARWVGTQRFSPGACRGQRVGLWQSRRRGCSQIQGLTLQFAWAPVLERSLAVQYLQGFGLAYVLRRMLGARWPWPLQMSPPIGWSALSSVVTEVGHPPRALLYLSHRDLNFHLCASVSSLGNAALWKKIVTSPFSASLLKPFPSLTRCAFLFLSYCYWSTVHESNL